MFVDKLKNAKTLKQEKYLSIGLEVLISSSNCLKDIGNVFRDSPQMLKE